MAEDMGERTEKPSPKKLGQARNRGQIPKSIDFSGAIDLIAAITVVWYFGKSLVEQLAFMTRSMLAGEAPGSGPTAQGLDELFVWTASYTGLILAPIVGIMFLAVAFSQFTQVGLLFTLEPLQPKFSKLDPIGGFKRLFGKRNLVKTLVSVIKLSIVLFVIAKFIIAHFAELAALPMVDLTKGAEHVVNLTIELAVWMLVLMLLIGIADFAYQRWQHTQDLRMTKPEVKDERRSMEGDEETKGRRLRMARSTLVQRIRHNVPKADVVVTNPTHFAVALRYDPDKMAAPQVVAKGADSMAFRIREIAAASGVPIVEKPALARALYAQVEVGRTITPELFEAVAEILAYVYRLNKRAA